MQSRQRLRVLTTGKAELDGLTARFQAAKKALDMKIGIWHSREQ